MFIKNFDKISQFKSGLQYYINDTNLTADEKKNKLIGLLKQFKI